MKQDLLLSANNLSFSYDGREVLHAASLEVHAGEFIGIIGPNGAGKSTLMKLLTGILHTNHGEILFEGKSLNRLGRRKIARILAYVPQETDFAFDFSVREIVSMGRYPYNAGLKTLSKQDMYIVDEIMDVMNLTEFSGRGIRELSGGEKQRVIVASALAQQPRALLLDEPTAALDLHHQIAIYQTLRDQQNSRGITVLVVTHDINLAAQYCRRMVLLHEGRKISDGPPDVVLKFQQIQDTFGVKVYIDINPLTKSLYILPYA